MGYYSLPPHAANPAYILGFIAFPVVFEDTTGVDLEEIYINVVIQHRFLATDGVVNDDDFHDFLVGSVANDEWIFNKAEHLVASGCLEEVKSIYSYEETLKGLSSFKEYVLMSVPKDYHYLAGRLSVFMWLNNMVYDDRMLKYVSEDNSALEDYKIYSNVNIFRTLSKTLQGKELFDSADRYADLPVEYIQHMLDAHNEGIAFSDVITGFTR